MRRLRFLVSVVLPFAAPFLVAQQPTASAPIPAPILSAQKVFLANGGSDLVSAAAFRKSGQANEPYSSAYSALQSWGHWQLLSSPDGADLILTVRFTAPVEDYSKGEPLGYSPQVSLTIADGKTHVELWTLREPVQGAFRKTTWQKNYADGVAGLMAQLKTLATPAAP